ncbi:hypothetical protein V5P93_004044 [Actinokineospora auranticolor]|uniref:Uncharacterized protein n=1 Tax=Actinokineospora auranticolor TaxID=155976 RepID=A0A2S6GCS7_9PSEU|nr:hypothetical protein [Actinokineospora auranticolor]PPK62788.1 hypothetical protein CLV40_13354 [Actinokineospora auranticolor]
MTGFLADLSRPQVTLAVVAACVLGLVVLVVAMIVSPRWRGRAPRVAAGLIGGVVALYLVGRAVAEFWIVDYANPDSYRDDWGGPSLLGVFAVHSGPGLAVGGGGAGWLVRRRRGASRVRRGGGA